MAHTYEESDLQDTFHLSAQNLLMPSYWGVMFKNSQFWYRIIIAILKHLIATGVQFVFLKNVHRWFSHRGRKGVAHCLICMVLILSVPHTRVWKWVCSPCLSTSAYIHTLHIWPLVGVDVLWKTCNAYCAVLSKDQVPHCLHKRHFTWYYREKLLNWTCFVNAENIPWHGRN